MANPLQDAMSHHKAGRLAEAELIYRKILAYAPNDSHVLHLMGALLLQQRKFNDAIELLQRAATIAPQVAETQFALADALRFAGRPAEAEVAYRKSIAIRPLFPSAHNGLGLALVQQQRMESAAQSFRRAIQLRGDYAEAHANLGAALAQQRKPREAGDVLRKAVQLNPNFAPAHNNLANVLSELEEFDEAIVHWSRAAELLPNYFDALFNLGKILLERGETRRAHEMLDRAVQLKVDDPDARFLRGLTLLLQGDLPAGFRDYRARAESQHLAAKLNLRSLTAPQWEGGDVAGKTILLHPEQGLGDTIQFVRYATLVAERRATVVLESPPELAALLATVPGVNQVITIGTPPPPCDVQASLLELPALFGTTLGTIPANVPYLTPAADRAEAWAKLLAEDPPGKRVGLVWSGNPRHTNDRRRSISLREFEPLAALKDVTFFSLQKGPAAQQVTDSTLTLKLIDHTARLTDFHETAAMISQLDLIIAADTSVAHLAGAMNKPVWILLPLAPDWRWMLDRTDSPWYPSASLMRQSKPNDWTTVIEQVVQDLRACEK